MTKKTNFYSTKFFPTPPQSTQTLPIQSKTKNISNFYILKVQIQMCTLCYDEYVAKYVADYNDEYKLTIAHPKMMSTMPNTMMNMCQI